MRSRQEAGKFLREHELPWIELEDRLDHLVVQVGITAVATGADVFHRDVLSPESRLSRQVLQVLHGGEVFHHIADRSEVDDGVESRADELKHLLEFLLHGVELIGAARQGAALDALLQPDPLEHRTLVQ